MAEQTKSTSTQNSPSSKATNAPELKVEELQPHLVKIEHAKTWLIESDKEMEHWLEQREQWYESELSRLGGELDQLKAEMMTVGHRAVRALRKLLMDHMPLVYRLTRSLLHNGRLLWCQRWRLAAKKDSSVQFTWNTRVVLNRPWPTGKPLVSVIMPNFNYGMHLEGAIDSVLDQTFQDFEIILVDDGSTDSHTLRLIATLDKPKTRVIRQANQGLPSARNTGIELANGKYICCLDPDDYLRPTYLEKCVYWLETQNFDICFSWLQEFGDSNDIWKNGPFLIDHLANANTVSVSAVFKKSAWKRAGGYKVAMTHGYEDWEFWLTLAEQGAIGHCIQEPLFLYRRHPSSMSAGKRSHYDKLVQDIKALHPEIYANQTYLETLKKRQKKNYFVLRPLCNLLRSKNFGANGKLNILLALPWFDLGGSTVIKKEVFSRLLNEGIHFTAIATNPIQGVHTENGLQLYEAFTKDCFNLARYLEGKDKFRFVEYLITSRDIRVLFLAGSTSMYQMLPAIKRRFPALRILDELYNVVGHIENNRQFHRFIDLNIVVNGEIKNHLCSLGEPEERIRIIPPGVDIERFDPKSLAYASYAERRPYKEFTFGFLGRLSPEKRPQDFVRIATQLPFCRFRMGGCGPIEEHIRNEIRVCDVSDRVFYEGVSDNPIQFFAGIDALIIPSEVEGIPLVLLEAMALEIPVIATAVGGISHILDHGRNGFIYKPGRLDQLGYLARVLSRMPYNERKAIGQRARHTVLESYTISKCAVNYKQLFKDLVHKRDIC